MKILRLMLTSFLCLIGIIFPALAQADQAPASFAHSYIKSQLLDTLWLESIVPEALRAEDEALFAKKQYGAPPEPIRYALPSDLEITPSTHGRWIDVEDGRLWMFQVRASGATDLNFGFGTFRLPAGATLHVFSPLRKYFRGPYGATDVREHGELWTPPIPGEIGVVELFVPHDAEFEPQLELVRVGRGYRDLFQNGLQAVLKQGSCNIDVACPESAGWDDEIRAVGVYSRGGSRICSGTLINNERQDRRPLFLTASHCGINSFNDASVVIFWNFESPTCGELGGGSLDDTTSGATLLTSHVANDMSLIELDSLPDPAFNVYYAGWDSTGRAARKTVGIHHPSVDEKAISFNDNPIRTVDNCIETGGSSTNTHWEVDDWERGTTEGGSSGSALFDRYSKRIIGYLSGGTAACDEPDGFDCYGKLSVGWDLGLSDWLDPYQTGTRQVDGLNHQECSPNDPLFNTVTVTYSAIPQADMVTSTGFWVYYGLEGLPFERKLVPFGDSALCSTSFFGNDPVPGMTKRCYLSTNNGLRELAHEGGGFQVPVGSTTRTYTRSDDCSITHRCSSVEFGSDPAYNFFKECTFSQENETVQATEGEYFTINWRQYPPLTGSIDGPNVVEVGQARTWTGSADGGLAPYSFTWQLDGQQVGTGTSVSLSFPTIGTHFLRLTITDSLSNTLVLEEVLIVTECRREPCRP